MNILEITLPIFLIILLGYIIGKKKKINTQPLTDLIVYITAPALIFTSITKSNINLTDFTIIASVALGIIFIMFFLTYLIFKLTKSKMHGLYLPMTVGNTSYIGYPVALFAFGVAGLSRAVVYDMMTGLFLYTFGIYLIHHKNDIKEVFKIPLLYATVFGILFNILKITTPNIIHKPLEMIGMITIPLALLILGYKLTEIKIKSAKIAFLASIFKIGIGFILAIIITSIFNIQGLLRNIIILQSAMPAAVMSMILTAKYKRDAACTASIVLITTVISIATIPLILHFMS